MNQHTDPPDPLRTEYRDATKLDARIHLHTHYSSNKQGLYRWIFEQLPLTAQSRVLDIGCGSGKLWSENAPRIPPGCRITLADFSPGIVADTAGQLASLPPRFTCAVCDIQALAFAAHSFDLVIANHMLYHVPDRGRAYREIRRVLRPGGSFYASTNSRHTMRAYDELIATVRGISPKQAGSGNDSRTVSGFNMEHGGDELAQAFTTVHLHRYEDALLIPAAAPLVAYAAVSGHLAGAQLDRFGQMVEDRITAHGPLRIEKGVGLFEAHVPINSTQ
ncbi:MAG: class I SAM-dependent methyltransferase [Chloroflexota bacterium]|nr:class I SAM-dependent methyltransferase [Chloroflexota bacterium]